MAGVLAFVVGGVGTIVAAIGDFGSDSGALGAARRNHVLLIVAAAAAAALGLACGALYTILKQGKANDDNKETEKASIGKGALFVGLLVLAGGVVLLAFSQWVAGGLVAWAGLALLGIAGVMWSMHVNLPHACGPKSFLIIGVLAVSAGVHWAQSQPAPGSRDGRTSRYSESTTRRSWSRSQARASRRTIGMRLLSSALTTGTLRRAQSDS
jgi:hypothetical protein